MLSLHPIPALQDNYIWLASAANGHALIVDPACAEPLHAALGALGLTPIAILLTHHHNDHIGGVPDLLRRYDLPVYAPHDSRIASASARVAEGQILTFPQLDLRLEVLEIPGHTLSHVAYFGAATVFCGDTLFSIGCGRLFEGTPAQMLRSLDRLAALPSGTRVCCGHEYTLSNIEFALTVEPHNSQLLARRQEATAQRAAGSASLPSSMGAECAANPFLRIDAPSVRSHLAKLGTASTDRATLFGALRRLKDQFRASPAP